MSDCACDPVRKVEEMEAERSARSQDIVDEAGPDYTGIICKGHLRRGIRRAANVTCDDGTFCRECFEEVVREWRENYVAKYPPCCHCHQEEGGMPNEFTDEGDRLCADCYWDLDAETKHKRRTDPEWRYGRVYSACKALLNMSEEEALAAAKVEVEEMEGGAAWLAAHVSPAK